MGLLAELGRLSIGAWSPGGSGGGYIATATYADSNDTAFDESIALEILSVDIQRSKLIPVSTIKCPTKFSSLDWGNPSRSHPAGLIAGGLVDGGVNVWDAATLIRAPKSPDENYGIVYSSTIHDKVKHTGPVRAVQFNPFLQNLLATGGADGQVLVWDLSNPSAGVSPRHPASKSGAATPPQNAPKEEITTLAWNRKVHNILSTATSTGVMNVWDLKQSRQVISIRNPRGRMRCTSLAWHPEIATQIVITCDEDDSTAAILWDLRNATTPVESFHHHSPKGIVSSSWSSHDSDLLLTSSKDGRTAVLSISTKEVIVDSPRSSDWNFDVKWSPRIPGLYLASSFDGRLSVNSILAASSAPSVSSETANALAGAFGASASDFRSGIAEQSPRTTDSQRVIYSPKKPPKWLKRPSSVSFSFGGYKSHFSAKDNSNVVMDSFEEAIPSLSSVSGSLDKILMDLTATDPAPAREWCQRKSKEAKSPKDKLGWDILSILLNTDSRRKLIEYLGFTLPPKDAGDDIAMPVFGLLLSQPIAVPVKSTPSEEHIPEADAGPATNSEAPANGIADMKLDGPAPWDDSLTDPVGDGQDIQGSLLDGDDSGKNLSRKESKADPKTNGDDQKAARKLSFIGKKPAEMDQLIKKAVIVADFKTAVDACLHVGKTADALIIAHAGGPELWLYAQEEYMSKPIASAGSKVIGAISGSKRQMTEFIKQMAASGYDAWKEALAAILTYSSSEELVKSCTTLGEQLMEKKNETGALACFLCASNVGRVASVWTEKSNTKGKYSAALLADHVKQLSSVVERIRIFTSAVSLSQGKHEIGVVRAFDEISGSILCEFGALMAIQGDYQAAVTYLGNIDQSSTCVYGLAENLNQKASDCLALSDSSPSDPSFHIANVNAEADFNNTGNFAYNGNGVQGVYANAPNAPPPNVPTNPPVYESPTPMYYTPPPPSMGSGTMNHSPQPPPPTQPTPYTPSPTNIAPPVPNPIQSVPTGNNQTLQYSSNLAGGSDTASRLPPVAPFPLQYCGTVTPGTRDTRPSRDPSSAYTDVLPAPTIGINSMPAPPQYIQAPGQHNVSPGADINGSYGMQGMPVHPMEPAMPPPPTDADSAAPRPFHPKAKQGAGARLHHSAEVAVKEGRRERAQSSSGTPGGPPRRSSSMSSSLSALVTETVYLDKFDTSKLGANESMIVKALKACLTQAQGMNRSGMYRKKMDDINKRLGKLAAGLSGGLIAQEISEKLAPMAKAMETSNIPEAQKVLAVLSKEYWDVHRPWLQGLKWLLDSVITGR